MKTQAQINARLNAYRNGTVDSVYLVKQWTAREPGFSPMEPGCIDVDKRYNAQCLDLIIDYVLWLTDNKVRMWGNAKDAIHNKFPDGWRIVENKPETVPKRGWIGVATIGQYAEFGHIYIVDDPGNTSQMKVLEQNWNGYANKKPSNRWDNYYGCTHFIVPPVAEETKLVKQTTEAKPQSKTIEIINDEISGYKMDKRGYNPKGIVIHNDAGSVGGKQYHKALSDANYNRLAAGIAHAYIDRNAIWNAIPDDKIAWHTGDGTSNGTGNHEYYGIEVCESLSASDKDFLANEQAVFQECARRLKKWGLPANRNTIRLHNEFINTACPHRSLKLHTGFDSQKLGQPNSADQIKLKDYFIKQIRSYMDGKTPISTTVISKPGSASTPATRSDSNGYKVNQYGTLYKTEYATFTANTAIITRYTGPFTSCQQAGTLQAGQSINYDEVMKQDGHVWVGYTAYDGQRVYLPVREWNKSTDGVGKLWGTIS